VYCKKCGKELIGDSKFCNNCGHQVKKKSFPWVMISSILLTLVIAIGGSVCSYKYYKILQLKNKITEAIGKDAGYTETILNSESDSPNITYKEFFDLCDKSIEGRTNLIIELRGLYPNVKYDLKEKLIDFLNSENELVRAKKAFWQRQLDLQVKIDIYDGYLKEVKYAYYSGYNLAYYLKIATQTKAEMTEIASNMIIKASTFVLLYKGLLSQEGLLVKEMDKNKIRFNTIFKKHEAQNTKEADNAIAFAQTI